MIFADVWTHRVFRYLDDETGVSEIRANDLIYCYEVPDLDAYKSANEYVTVQVSGGGLVERGLTLEMFMCGAPRCNSCSCDTPCSSHLVTSVQVTQQRIEKNQHYDPSFPHTRQTTLDVFGVPRVIVLPKKEPVTGEKIRVA